MVFQVPQLLHAIGFTPIIDNSIRGNSLKSPSAPNLPNVMVSGTRILSDFGRAAIKRSQPRFGLDSIENLTGIEEYRTGVKTEIASKEGIHTCLVSPSNLYLYELFSWSM